MLLGKVTFKILIYLHVIIDMAAKLP